jgi:hypothetical protein
MLGGQHGEESEVKDEVSGKEKPTQDCETPQEEVMLPLWSS